MKCSTKPKAIEYLASIGMADTVSKYIAELEAENALLKAEAERYRLASLRVDVSELHAQFNRALFDDTIAENARLKAEVERLTKAGDEMLSEWASGDEKDAENFLKALVIWNAAKEGKKP